MDSKDELIAVVQRLVDKSEIVDVLHRYARGIDLLDRVAYESCFHDPVEVAFPTWRGEVRVLTPLEWTDYCWRLAVGFDATQHSLSNHFIEFQGHDEATCLSYLRARHHFTDPQMESYIAGGHYMHDLVRTDEGWKIRRWRFVMTWEQGDPGAFKVAMSRPGRTDIGSAKA